VGGGVGSVVGGWTMVGGGSGVLVVVGGGGWWGGGGEGRKEGALLYQHAKDFWEQSLQVDSPSMGESEGQHILKVLCHNFQCTLPLSLALCTCFCPSAGNVPLCL